MSLHCLKSSCPVLILLIFVAVAGGQSNEDRASGTNLPFSGKILLDDGMPPAQPVGLERVCGQNVYEEGSADRDGPFHVEVNLKEISRTALRSCSLRAALPGYRSSLVPFARASEDGWLGSIVLQRLGKGQGASMSATSLAAPPLARQAFHQAVREIREGKERDAKGFIQALEKAVQEYPKYAEAWNLLGQIYLDQGAVNEARRAISSAIRADPWYVTPYSLLLRLELEQENWKEVLEISGKVLHINPYLNDVEYYRAMASLGLDDLEAAQQARRRIESNTQGQGFPLLHHLRGLIYGRKGEFDKAAEEYRRYLDIEPGGTLASDLRDQLKAWETAGVLDDPAAKPGR